MKLTFLLFGIICGFSMKVFAQDNLTYKYHTLYPLGTSITEAEALACYLIKNPPGVVSGNGIKRIKANILTENKLRQKSVYKVGTTYYFINNAYDHRHSDEDVIYEDVSVFQYIPLSDLDQDGLPNSCDACANSAGPVENNGCPLSPAELSINPDVTTVTSSCSSCSFLLRDLGNNRHIIAKNAGIMSIGSILRNTGQSPAGSFKIDFYLSTNNTLSSDDYKFSNSTISLSSLSANSNYSFSTSVFGSSFPSSQAYGSYYVLVVIDSGNTVSESNENNNITVIPITYRENP